MYDIYYMSKHGLVFEMHYQHSIFKNSCVLNVVLNNYFPLRKFRSVLKIDCLVGKYIGHIYDKSSFVKKCLGIY